MAPAGETCAVLGGAGFLGQHLTKMLASKKPGDDQYYERVRVLDVAPLLGGRDTGVEFTAAELRRVDHTIGSVSSGEDLDKVVEGASCVFHLASVVDVRLNPGPNLRKVNVEGTKQVIDACRRHSVPRLVYTSSEDIFQTGTPCVLESGITCGYAASPPNQYCATKIEADKLVLSADGGEGGLRTVSVRSTHIYGPGDAHTLLQAAAALKAGQVVFRFGDGTARVDLVYVENLAHAHLLAAQALRDKPDQVSGKGYIISESFRLNFFEFLQPYMQAVGLAFPKWYVPVSLLKPVAFFFECVHAAFTAFGLGSWVEPQLTLYLCYAIGHNFTFVHDAATRDLGYHPIVSSEEGTRRTMEWFVRQPVLLPGDLAKSKQA
ncbi:3beta-hydroxysteroid-dehydrogenase/decarboxylase isoform 1 [Diplonema papillatum]|nr:3beta-hydroxysteroid-dehydrogenase/decarboxylase isoform 1 [Diplonema papillatum]